MGRKVRQSGSRAGARTGDRRSSRAGRSARASHPLIGYATVSGRGAAGRELKKQTDVVAQECERRGLSLLEVVGERSSGGTKDRPGLTYVLQRISSGEAEGLVVSELDRLANSASELGALLKELNRVDARLVVAGEGLDTGEERGKLCAKLLVEVSRWEREKLRERTREGLAAAKRRGRATGPPSVKDFPELRERIARMRSEGMTLQAIADQLNADGVPTLRGGAK